MINSRNSQTKKKLRRLAILLVITGSAVLLAASTHAALIKQSYGSLQKSYVASSTATFTTSSTSYVPVPGATLDVTIPAGAPQMVIVSFSAASSCFNPNPNGGWCTVTMFSGRELDPAVGTAYSFDSARSDGAFTRAYTVDRSIVLSPGTHKITVRAIVSTPSAPGTEFTLVGWHLSAATYAPR